MTDIEKKEEKIEKKHEKIVEKIAEEVERLDSNASKLATLEADTEKKHSFKKWSLEKKMIHEVKKILHEAGKYEKFDEGEFAREIEICESLQNELN